MVDETVKGTSRTYVVLCKPTATMKIIDGEPGQKPDPPVGAWSVAGEYEGTTDLVAIKAAMAANGGKPENAEWVAVPARSWRPRRREVQKIERERWL